jgi:hypothetical protein
MQRVAPDYCNLTCRPVPAVYGHLEPAKRSIGELLGGEEERWHQFVYLSIYPLSPIPILVLYGIMLTLPVRVRHVRNPSHWFQYPFLHLSPVSVSLSLCSVQLSACMPLCAVRACHSPQ